MPLFRGELSTEGKAITLDGLVDAAVIYGPAGGFGMRGEMRGSCPLGDMGELLVFTAWSISMCYMVVGSVFRLSLLGVFTAPLVCFLISVALIPGMLETNPPHADHVDGWRESHAAFSVMAYGALGLAAVSAVMFLVLDRQLKGGSLRADYSGIFLLLGN